MWPGKTPSNQVETAVLAAAGEDPTVLRRRIRIAVLLCRYGLERHIFRRIALDLALPQRVVRREIALIFGLVADDAVDEFSGESGALGRADIPLGKSPKVGPQDALPGFLRAEFVRCGKPNCRCRAGGDALHGPYVRRYFREGGTRRRAYVRKADIQATRQLVELHRTRALDSNAVARLINVLGLLSDEFTPSDGAEH